MSAAIDTDARPGREPASAGGARARAGVSHLDFDGRTHMIGFGGEPRRP